jgi:hypothetical protein
MGTFGITDFDRNNALCKDGTIDKNNPSNPCVNNGGVNLFNFAKLNLGDGSKINRRKPISNQDTIQQSEQKDKENLMKILINQGNQGFPNQSVSVKPETFKNVKCNDGSTQTIGSNPLGGRVDMPCKNNGGVSLNQEEQKPRTFIEMNRGYIIIALVLVAGYFAYKKFKK